MKKRNWIILLAAVVAIALIVIAGIFLTGGFGNGTTPAEVEPTPTPYKETLTPSGEIVPLPNESQISTPAPTQGGAQATPKDVSSTDGNLDDAAEPTNAPKPAVTKYTYSLLMQNTLDLLDKYPDDLTRLSIGTTAFGRDILCLRVGNEQAEHKVLLVGGVRGNEYGTGFVMMKQIETYLSDTASLFRGKTYRSILDKACLYYVPMLNPDGVELCLRGLESVPANEKDNVAALLQNAYDFQQISYMPLGNDSIIEWTANGKGIDVAINFGTGTMESSAIVNEPSCTQYPGTPFESAEAQALRGLCESTPFDVMAVFSGLGDTIDWSFGQDDKGLSYTLAAGVSQSSDFTVIENGPTPEQCVTVEAHQWFIRQFRKPALKISGGQSLPYDAQGLVYEWRSLSAVPLYLADESQWNYEAVQDTPDPQTTPDPDEPGYEHGDEY